MDWDEGVIQGRQSIGVPEEEAHHYQRELRKGRTIVMVKAASGKEWSGSRLLVTFSL